MIFNTKSDTFSEIIAGDKKYFVPKFQRDYSWTETEWEDLLIDIENLEDNESHYMGYLVFQSMKNKEELWVIDGQQRMTTLSLLMLAILSALNELTEDPQNQDRIKVLRQKYIGSQNPISLNVQSKLVLNRNNNDHYKRLCTLESIPKRKIKSSERKMTACLEFFKEKLKPKCPTGEQLAAYAENISRKLFFTTITVDDESNAYKVFETLNARGVKLSVPDLMKNYLFSLVDNDTNCASGTIDDLDVQWAYIAEQLGKNDFDKFIRTEWNTKNPLVTKNNLFKKIKSKIDTATKAFEYINTLVKCVEIYSALQDPKDEYWANKDFHNKCLSPLRTLNIFNITQPQGVLLASYLKFNIDGFMKVLSYIEALSIRYNVICQNNPTEQEGFYNKLARKIFSGELTTHVDVKNELLLLFPKDQEFYYAFSRRQFKTSQTDKKVRHLLTLLERFLQPDNQLEDSALTLEHILPKNPDKGWEEFNDDELEEYSARLGNMTLLNKGKNNSLGNTSYVQKKIAYTQSTLTITKMIGEYDIWDAKAIDDRQNWLANKAKELWKL